MARLTNPEINLISAIIKTQDPKTSLRLGISKSMFHSFHEEYEWIEAYIQRHHRTPSRAAFKSRFRAFPLKVVDDVEHYCEEVRKHHVTHEMTEVISRTVDLMKDEDLDKAVRFIHQGVIRVSNDLSGHSSDSDIFEHFGDVLSEVERRTEAVGEYGSAGVLTGFPTLDERTGGPQPGQTWLIGGRLGEGKTWLMLRMAIAAVMANRVVQYDALEMTRAEVGMRIHGLLSGTIGKQLFDNSQLNRGQGFSMVQYKRYLRLLKKKMAETDAAKGARFHVADASRGAVGLVAVAAQIERNRPDIMFIDYAQLMDRGGQGDYQDLGKLSGALSQLAQEYRIPLVIGSQLNRQSIGRDVAGAEGLSESDKLGQDAHVIVNLKKTSEHSIMFRCVKNRHGQSGFRFYAHFDPSMAIFKEITKNEWEELKDNDADAKDAAEDD